MVGAEFLSGEASASPAVEPMLTVARSLEARGVANAMLSARNGSRTTTHAPAPLAMLRAEDFIEIADYDPHLDRMLCIGRREPHAHGGMHHLMLRAKKEVHAIVMVEAGAEGRGPGAEGGRLPVAKMHARQLDAAMSALEALRGRDAIRLGRFVLVAATTPATALARFEQVME